MVRYRMGAGIILKITILLFSGIILLVTEAHPARIKDIADVKGVRPNQLI